MKKRLAIISSGFISLLLPFFAFAQRVPATPTTSTGNAIIGCTFTANNPTIADVFNYGTCMIYNSIIPLLIALAIAMFIWGVIQYVLNDAEEAKKAKGKQFMLWGIIAITVIVSIWGLVHILTSTFNISFSIPLLPQ